MPWTWTWASQRNADSQGCLRRREEIRDANGLIQSMCSDVDCDFASSYGWDLEKEGRRVCSVGKGGRLGDVSMQFIGCLFYLADVSNGFEELENEDEGEDEEPNPKGLKYLDVARSPRGSRDRQSVFLDEIHGIFSVHNMEKTKHSLTDV
jgi:hypothetical protein